MNKTNLYKLGCSAIFSLFALNCLAADDLPQNCPPDDLSIFAIFQTGPKDACTMTADPEKYTSTLSIPIRGYTPSFTLEIDQNILKVNRGRLIYQVYCINPDKSAGTWAITPDGSEGHCLAKKPLTFK